MNLINYSVLTNQPFQLEIAILAAQRNVGARPCFNLQSLTSEECYELFRFDAADIHRLSNVLKIPKVLKVKGAVIVSGLEALCILLRRLSYPNRLSDITMLFGRNKCHLSQIINYMLDYIETNFNHLLNSLNHIWLNNENLRKYADAISDAGSPLPNCWGFIDGTTRPMCRPKRYQRHNFNGHKRYHALKYQSVLIPNGLIANLWGPMEGRRHDSYMLSESGLLQKMDNMEYGGENYYLYGDSGYPLTTYIITPFKGSRITLQQRMFNRAMSGKRVNVEQGFAKIISLFAFVDYKKNQKLFLQQIGKFYKCAVLFTNCHTCIYGSLTSTVYGINAPSLEEYVGN